MLAIEMLLLTGRYVATNYNDRSSCEWPPHPARLFSALVATHHAAAAPDPEERTALEWLAEQGPPEIVASNVNEGERHGRDVVTVFVPVNDSSLFGSLDGSHQETIQMRRALDAAQSDVASLRKPGAPTKELQQAEKVASKAAKDLLKREQNLSTRMSSAVVEQSKLSAQDQMTARQLLPEGRVRQPRTFPSIAPDDPVVGFVWPGAKPNAAASDALTRLALRVIRIGHSSSLVRLRLLDECPAPTLIPDELATLQLRVPLLGQLGHLEQQFQLHQETLPRVLPYVPHGYRIRASAPEEALPASVFEDDWLVLELLQPERYRALPIQRTVDVARSVRNSLLAHSMDPIPEVLSGKSTDGTPSQRPHLAVLPLPVVAYPHADGHILGVALVFPRKASDEDRRQLFLALDRWEQSKRGEDNDDEESPVLPLDLRGAPGWGVRRSEDPSRLRTLPPATWCKPRRAWASVSPIALDRHPGDLGTRDPKQAARAFAEAESFVALACERIGLPTPSRVVVTRSALVVGSEKASRFPRFPAERDKAQRALVHAAIEFAIPVRGPVVLGAGRYLGLGLCRPLDVPLTYAPTGSPAATAC